MDRILVGEVFGTHGIDGEIRILSNFQYKDLVFRVSNKLIINDKYYTISSVRKHKRFELVKLNDYNNINQVLFLMRSKVYIDRSILGDVVLDSDLINYRVVDQDNNIGKVLEVSDMGNGNKVIRVLFDRVILIPYNSNFVSIDKDNKTIVINVIEGM